MGGNALKQYHTTRLDREPYFELVEEFSREFVSKIRAPLVLIPAYKSKPSFGDADFLVTSDGLPDNWVQLVVSEFNLTPEQWVKNGNVLTIGYKNFQVDLIDTQLEDLQTSLGYYSFNDLGNLLGRIGHKLGIKIGQHGLSLVVRSVNKGSHILKEIVLSKSFDDVFTILGLDGQKFSAGFETLEDIFKFVASSKYFDPEIFALEHRSATSRIRDKKRATYSAFLRWLAETNPPANHHFESKSELGGYSIRLPYYNTEVLQHWPWAQQAVDQLIARDKLNDRFAEVYNGVLVGLETGLDGPARGNFMSEMAKTIDDEVKQKWISEPTLAVIAVSELYFQLGLG